MASLRRPAGYGAEEGGEGVLLPAGSYRAGWSFGLRVGFAFVFFIFLFASVVFYVEDEILGGGFDESGV